MGIFPWPFFSLDQDENFTVPDQAYSKHNKFRKRRKSVMKDRSVDMHQYLNYDSVRKRVVYKLVNTERNRDLLENIPHMDFLDLSVVFQCLVSQEGQGTAYILVYNVHMKLWDMELETLYHDALENTPRIMPYEIKSMEEAIRAENPDCDGFTAESADSVPMYVLTNIKKIEGAACMLYPGLIREFADRTGSSLFIIPSSVHELLILPVEDMKETEEIRSMIREINDTQVQPDEILSYSLYCYDREEGRIYIC